MKTRLLRQLRKEYKIEERNGKYQVSHKAFGNLYTPSQFMICKAWSNNLLLCRKYIMYLILLEARGRFSVPKRRMK